MLEKLLYGIEQRILGFHIRAAVRFERGVLSCDDVDNKEFLTELLEAMYSELPAPKKK